MGPRSAFRRFLSGLYMILVIPGIWIQFWLGHFKICIFSCFSRYPVQERVSAGHPRRPEMGRNSRSAVILTVSWIETCIGLFIFSLRFLSNWKFVGRFRWDFALASLTVVSVTFCPWEVSIPRHMLISVFSNRRLRLLLRCSCSFQSMLGWAVTWMICRTRR